MSQPISINTAPHPYQECLTSVTGLALERAQRADIVLGMPRHDCRFHGICKVEKQGTSPALKDCACKGEAVAGWLLRPKPSYCVLLIEKGGLTVDRERYHFARRWIELSQGVDVCPFYAKRGGKKYLLRQGSYPLQSTKDYYALYLPLMNQAINQENPIIT